MMRAEDITPDVLDQVAAEWEQQRLVQLARSEVVELGRRFHQARLVENRLDVQCMIRARRLVMLGFDKRDIGELFDVDRRTVNRWLKGMENA
jgi:CRP-like cAMP-binding protein